MAQFLKERVKRIESFERIENQRETERIESSRGGEIVSTEQRERRRENLARVSLELRGRGLESASKRQRDLVERRRFGERERSFREREREVISRERSVTTKKKKCLICVEWRIQIKVTAVSRLLPKDALYHAKDVIVLHDSYTSLSQRMVSVSQ